MSAAAVAGQPDGRSKDFWIESDEYFALGLDADGNQVDALSSSNGHLLWSGIVETSKAKAVARHLMGPRMFSGWGIRTLAEGERRFNPVGYHVGTIWPFDNSFIASGCDGTASSRRRRRSPLASSTPLPSSTVVCRRRSAATSGRRQPIPWSTQPRAAPRPGRQAAPLLLLRTMLGLEPLGDHLVVDPALASGIGVLALLEIQGRWGRFDAFARGEIDHKEVGSATAARGGSARRR